VIYASDIPSANLHGSWSLTADTTAAGGTKAATTDLGVANTAAALAAPVDYVDVPFTAPAGVPYTLWLRVKALNNSKSNDSLFVQFSDALANSAAAYPMNTTQALVVNLATDTTAASLSNWGWVDGAYWLAQPATLTFATSGAHTLRVQVREDGVQFDQIVLSPSQYFNASASCPTTCTGAPGPVSNDATIVPKPGSSTTPPATPVWTTQDVGAVGLPGSAVIGTNGVFTIQAAGADIWGTADSFNYTSQPVTGDHTIVARVTGLQNTNTYAKAGVMFRETTGAGSIDVILDVRPGGSVEFMSRSTTGGSTTYMAGATQTIPAWLQLARSGSTFTGSVSADGVTWTTVGTITVSMASSARTGLAVTSHTTSTLTKATFDNVLVR
jgi:hypothetical protein